MNSTPNSLVKALAAEVPELHDLLEEHIHDYDEILPHVFFGDLTAWVIRQDPSSSASLDRVLAMLDEAFGSGSTAVEELVYVSFLEGLRVDPALRKHFGPHLSQGLDEQL
jgi:hypothetical protein